MTDRKAITAGASRAEATVPRESAIAGLIALGRTRKQAEAELREAEKRRLDEMEREIWGL